MSVVYFIYIQFHYIWLYAPSFWLPITTTLLVPLIGNLCSKSATPFPITLEELMEVFLLLTV
ncbi:predicted protein [Sclerotinia sclerotiorum 1980 UF-70]|uniref:Uncharacterized protein n=1 Tax=Sclerotinia sclerotiorum (strain ATCC 18683 / 1980 / Ss-1) TaxID=665079 RepID=A7EWD0_SCLS1|nr:predicted protein [Sclerotinia sclerotiorum 1980 UF-70]EDN93772.1 predicted protein [Sclerotinia sclerotiorum 1980 UF-70]